MKFGNAQGVGRLEDIRLLTGAGRYVDDIAPKEALHALFFRSPVAHAAIDALDLAAAEAAPGVRLILTADRLSAAGVSLGMNGVAVRNQDGTRGAMPERPLLAKAVLRHVGEAVAMIVADTLNAARDAAEMIGLEYSDLPVKLDLAPGGAVVHPEAPDNRAYDWAMGDAAQVEAALAASAHRVVHEVVHNRVIVNTMEPRVAFAEWDGARLHLCFSGQGVWVQKGELARMLALDPAAVRVTNPDVGGGFGMKAMTYPEYTCLAAAARMLGRPVRWVSERTEAMLSDNGARDLVVRTELGFDADHRITAYRADVTSNMGAYNAQFAQAIQSELFSKVFTGCYDIQTALLTAQGIYTHTTPLDAYRGAGRPEAIMTLECAMDNAARVLGLDPFALRARNFVRAFPYKMINGLTIDVGDFTRVLNRLQAEADLQGYAARQARSAAKGLTRGRGLACYIESILGSPTEAAQIVYEADGTVTLFVGTQSNGQGHETVYTAMLAEQTGIDPGLIRVVQGDSDRIAKGGGTGGSRSVTVQGTAMRAVVAQMIPAFAAFLQGELGAGVAFDDGRFGAPGSNLRLTLIEAAERARAAGREDLLSHRETITLEAGSFPNGAHLAEVELDPETGHLRLDRYVVVDDFGNMINPALVAGQVHGGVAQGFGQAVMENAVFDDFGQLLTASFMDYAMPRAQDLPMIQFATEPVPSTTNPLGMKGCGEAGTVGSLGAISNAVSDAMAQHGVSKIQMPFTPSRVWSWLKATVRDGGDADNL
ncbi:xanthine dehydrogenase family protein molybdopterin-binding subunit [Pseudorhodobacter sp. E13]|uniref:xanthine dehydrogenase family protein molybdopterin-binding subunit n=1 Tax=Pseudorhodobacter sp. E13 TaxID=2487931 RepID=UPI000F8EEA32|nr:xanthine dehydrogenase family protein molybdopterin-binding subunit [Pseudorhodobacter sp. E13]RUS60036.1 xanthine dehydrogenase family protein molybdopterin-binding subunit [Pseudorhodobacter sp. E13]